MKYILLALGVLSTFAMANEKAPSVELVKDSFEYCTDYAQGEEDADKLILTCVNEELAESGYKTFKSLKEIKDFIKDK
ncbi:hypothetical protein [Thalassotalea marina]|uniref:Uncharacterized protein n=1 Tax=Thalassotalea marina TaxID=1673741 RepID=A0A919BIH0_9GAMM|nr:hypothetical protein [Thalassotalea marina]GHF89621.1 hypothetical protein GCM10017161_16850 [Thalassotalea marina]